MTLQVACEAFLEPEAITCDGCNDIEEAEMLAMIEQASDIIAIITGGKVSGRCTDTVRPCSAASCGCSRLSSCGCSPVNGITLAGPFPSIDAILIDGDPFTDYVIVDGNLLVRSDGRAWPGYQDITKPSDQEGTFEIEYTHGIEIPILAKNAAAEIVCSFLKSSGQDSRAPHPNTRGMSIAGVTITLEQQAMEIKRRSFMMPYVIRLLTVYAPDGPTPALVYSPELEDGWRLHHVELPTGS